jgi:hypothetical protein
MNLMWASLLQRPHHSENDKGEGCAELSYQFRHTGLSSSFFEPHKRQRPQQADPHHTTLEAFNKWGTHSAPGHPLCRMSGCIGRRSSLKLYLT